MLMDHIRQSRETVVVKLFDQYPMYELGLMLGKLRETSAHTDTDGLQQWYACYVAEKQVRAVLNGDHPLDFCRRAALDLVAELNKIMTELRREDGVKTVQPIPKWRMGQLVGKIDIFEHQLSGELSKTASYVVPKKGIFSTELLAENADHHIPENIRERLPSFVIDEYRQAGRCLAFGLYSACGFHAARAVESLLRTYYERFIGPPPDKAMGLLASHLEDMFKAGEKRALLPRENTVRHIRDIANLDRNPLMHRGVQLKEIDATTIFNSTLGVLVEMSKELADLEDEQDSLPFGNDDSLFKAVPVDEPDEAQKQEPQRQPPKKKKPKSTSSPAD